MYNYLKKNHLPAATQLRYYMAPIDRVSFS